MDTLTLGGVLAAVGLMDIVLANVLRERFPARVRTLLSLTGVLFVLGGLVLVALNMRSAP